MAGGGWSGPPGGGECVSASTCQWAAVVTTTCPADATKRPCTASGNHGSPAVARHRARVARCAYRLRYLTSLPDYDAGPGCRGAAARARRRQLLPGRHPHLTCRRSSAAFNGVALASTEHRCCWSGTAVAQRRAGAHRGGAVPRRAGLATRGPPGPAILLALAAAVGYGRSDLAARLAARRASVDPVAP